LKLTTVLDEARAKVAPRAGAWIETLVDRPVDDLSKSRPARARGLKLYLLEDIREQIRSRPARARGLKLERRLHRQTAELVAPRAGAWIETPLPGLRVLQRNVAPRAGAWIETQEEGGGVRS